MVRVAVGMNVATLREGSTYPLGEDPSAGGRRIGTYEISTPYTLVVEVGEAELKIEDIGGDNLTTQILIREGRVASLAVRVQRRLLDLNETIEAVRVLQGDLRAAGFSDLPTFVIQNMSRGATRPSILSLEDARAALARQSPLIAEMNLFAGRNADIVATLNVLNGPRVLRVQNSDTTETAIEATIREARQGREWTLELVITKRP